MSVVPLNSIVRLASLLVAVPSCGDLDPPDCTGEGPTYSVNGRRLHEEVAKGKRRGAEATLPLAVYLLTGIDQVLPVARCEAITTAAADQSAFAVASVR